MRFFSNISFDELDIQLTDIKREKHLLGTYDGKQLKLITSSDTSKAPCLWLSADKSDISGLAVYWLFLQSEDFSCLVADWGCLAADRFVAATDLAWLCRDMPGPSWWLTSCVVVR